MRIVAISAAILMAAAACTGQKAPSGTSDSHETITPAAPLAFSDEPLWAIGESGATQTDTHSGLEQVYSVELVGSRLVLFGNDEDGDLNPHGLQTDAVAVLDARTGESIWSLPERTPLPDDPLMTVSSPGGGAAETHVVEIDGEAALVIAYEKYVNDFDDTTDSEIGVVALSLESGTPIASARIQDGTLMGQDVHIGGSDGEEVLLDVVDDNEGSAEAMIVNLASGDRSWTREDMAVVEMIGDTVLIENPYDRLGETDSNVTFEAVDRATGETLWAHPPSDIGNVVIETSTDEVIVADTAQGGMVLDSATGEQLQLIEGGIAPGCATDGATLIACTAANEGLELVPLEQTPNHLVALPDTEGFEPLAVSSGWVFTDQPGESDGTGLALDGAGNSMDTPGRLAGHDDELAVFYTGTSPGEVGTISVHTIES